MIKKGTDASFLKKAVIFGLSSLAAILIGYIHMLTGKELALSLFFLIPIVTATWHTGTLSGVIMAVLSIFIWLLADLSMLDSYSAKWLPFVNEILRLTVFLFIVFILHRMKAMIVIHKNLSILDSLTNLLNRRGFNIEGFKEIERSRRTGNPFSIVYMDIDNFKGINDSLGHHTGDAVLVNVARILKSRLRNMDIVARLGGDEFLIMLPRTSGKSAEQAIAKLKKSLDETMQRNNWNVSFSFGIASFSRGIPESVLIALSAADSLMYKAKNSGKDKIIIEEANPDGSFTESGDHASDFQRDDSCMI